MRLPLARFALFSGMALGLAGWGLLAYWVLKADPWYRLILASKAGRFVGRDGAVVLIGDSIMNAVGSPCATFVNLALPGARARDLSGELIAEVGKFNPGIILIMIGINDLRMGDGPAKTAQSVATLARRLQAVAPGARVVVLTPLPITRNEIAWAADNAVIRETTQNLHDELREGNLRISDFSEIFGKDELAHEVTDDGLHLNSVGISRLAALIEAVALGAGAKNCR
jgi:lysophospholipase L1-like esterase